jgi:acyl-CoA thioester hydrolase
LKAGIDLPLQNYHFNIMKYSKTYQVKEEHIDVQGIMDGLYYPFYMEWCRHDFIKEVLGFDFEIEAKNGIYMVLSNYSLHFLRSLKKDDIFTVTCDVYKDKSGMPKLHFRQSILLNDKIMTKAVFSGTCIPSTGGRPYLPASVIQKLENVLDLNVEHAV